MNQTNAWGRRGLLCYARPLLLLLLLVALVPSSQVATSPIASPDNTTAPAAATMPFPDLVTTALPAAEKAKWDALGRKMWDFLMVNDFDFVDSTSGNAVPPTLPNAVAKQPVMCGRIARLWIRVPFHDCGTYDRATEKGGCNGSLRKELPATEPLLNPLTGAVIFNDTFEELGANISRADNDFDPSRRENTGFAVSTSFYYKMKFLAEDIGLVASWADIQVYAGMLSVAACKGPHIAFVPGRVDSSSADAGSMLPPATATAAELKAAYERSGLGLFDGLLVQGCHSVACFAAGCLDSTPNRLDTAWVKELLAWNGSDPSRICPFGANGLPIAPTSQCFAPFDAQLLNETDALAVLKLLATSDSITNATQLVQRIVQALTDAKLFNKSAAAGSQPDQAGAGADEVKVFSLQAAPAAFSTSDDFQAGGGITDTTDGSLGSSSRVIGPLLWRVNLCTPDICDAAQWAFNQMFASAYYRMTSLGLPDAWIGHDAALTGAESLDADTAGNISPVTLSPQSSAGAGTGVLTTAATSTADSAAARAASTQQRSAAGALTGPVGGGLMAIMLATVVSILLAGMVPDVRC